MDPNEKVYLDHAATTPVLPEVLDAMVDVYLHHPGNPSSLHGIGQDARDIVERARATVARCIGARPEEIVFTGSGTESDNIAIQGAALAMRRRGNHVITSAIEHPAVKTTVKQLEAAGFMTTEVPVDVDGILDMDKFRAAIMPETVLVTIMHANNEIGTIQPIAEIGEVCAAKGIIFHTDAVQSFGKIPTDPGKLGIHMLSASAHKIYGPKGVGILFIKGGGMVKEFGKYVHPIIHGGGHERGFRPATENVAGIAGLAKACEIAFRDMDKEGQRESTIRDGIIDRILGEIDGSMLNGHRTKRLPNNVNVGIKHVEGESMLLRLDIAGFEVSTGSACSSHDLRASHVLLALGRDPATAHGSLRITIGRSTTKDVADRFVDELKRIVASLRAISPLAR
nr:cysteine desulfurase family protein [Candidatus Sigynarchaeum springense]MDO8119157.1 cysteine desulfurase family protein [Candidatus Sigynarchaeota archaeon]